MVASLALLAVACTVVQVEDVGELADDEVLSITQAIADATAVKSLGEVRVEAGVEYRCPDGQREPCATAAAARTRCEDVILLRLFGGLSSVRVEARRYSGAAAPVEEVRNLPRHGDRTEAVDRLTAIIAPLPRSALVTGPPIAAPSAPERGWVQQRLPWVLLGGAVLAAGAGVGFELSSRDARSSLEGEVLDGARADVLQGRVEARGTAAQVLFAGAGLLLLSGVALFVF